MTVLIVHCTCPDAETADRLAHALVEEFIAGDVDVSTNGHHEAITLEADPALHREP